MLAVTGAEALYADMGHFNAKSIRVRACLLAHEIVGLYRPAAGSTAAQAVWNPDTLALLCDGGVASSCLLVFIQHNVMCGGMVWVTIHRGWLQRAHLARLHL